MDDHAGQLSIAAIPDWFTDAVSVHARSFWAAAAGARIHYLAWNEGDAALPPLLFVHGFGGHAHWWDAIAPFFITRFRVYALDLSGMGDSERRAHYSMRQHSADILAVIDAIGDAPATVVAHSYGGSRLFRACADSPHRIARAIVLDSWVAFDGQRTPVSFGGTRPYADLATALARFRLVPDQPSLSYAFDHIARHSVREVPGGWTWKFDPAIFAGEYDEEIPALLSKIATPIDYVYGELSRVVSVATAQRIHAAVGHGRSVEMPGAGHHLMLDQPLALIAVLRTLLA